MALLPLADEGRSWDAGAARKRIKEWAGDSRSKYARAFLYSSGSGSKLVAGDFKFPIADVIDGQLKAVPRAIMAAAAIIQGARGGTKISSSAISSIKSKLSSYYSKMGKTPPWSSKESGIVLPKLDVEIDHELYDQETEDWLEENEGTQELTAESVAPYTVTVTGGNSYFHLPSATGTITTSGTNLAFEGEVAEVTGSSMGGHSPKGDVDPERRLVKSFGKWAKGKQHICVRVLEEHHPELCTHRPGGCNALCAWMKDQFLGTTKWRKGSKRHVGESGVFIEESGVIIDFGFGEGEEFIGGPLALDIITESEMVDKENPVSRPSWVTDEILKDLADKLDLDAEPDPKVVEAAAKDIAYEKITTRLRKMLQDRGQKKVKEALGKDYGYCWVTIKETHPEFVVYESDEERAAGGSDSGERRQLYRQDYKVDENGDVALEGAPTKVEIQYVATKSDVEATVPDPYDALAYVGEATAGVGGFGTWQKVNGVSVFVRKSDGKIVLGPKKYKGKKLSEVKGSTAKESSVESTQPTGENDTMYVDVETAKGNVTVQMRKSDGLVLSGPRSLKGAHLPPVPDDLVVDGATESVVTESDVAARYEVSEIFSLDHAVVESAATTGGGRPKTPTGREVDAIIRIITPGPGNSRDGFFYPSQAITATHKVFEGLKMYSDHLSDDEERKLGGRPRSLKDWVSTVKETWVDGQGCAFGGADFVDEEFAKKAKKGKDDIGVSVRAGVRAKPGRVNGRPYKVVEGFTTGRSVDWVTEAGARGGLEEIAESAKNEGVDVADKAISEMTLDELQAARPDLLTEYAERVEAAGADDDADDGADDSAGESGDEGDDEGLTEDRIRSIVESAVSAALEAERGRHRQRDKLSNRERLDMLLASESSFKDPTRQDLKRELADLTFDDEVGESGEIVKTGTQKFEEHAKARIDERKKELAEYLGITEVIDTGPTGVSVRESSGHGPVPAHGITAGIERSLGLAPPAQETKESSSEKETAAA